MNFTREPIIETVITPREGCKLVVRSSKGNGTEDYFVDAVEVVSFGHSFFFRSQERPKSFLVPVSDYEILELKETRMVLKNVASDRSIKIGGGREANVREKEEDPTLADSRPAPEQKPKREKRRRGRRTRDKEPSEKPKNPPVEAPEDRVIEKSDLPNQDKSSKEEMGIQQEAPKKEHKEETPPKAPSFISKLFPPPSTLITDSLSRYKQQEVPSDPPVAEQKLPESTTDSDSEQ